MADRTPPSEKSSPDPDPRHAEWLATLHAFHFLGFEIRDQSDRGAAIIAATFVEDVLTKYVKSRMLIVKEKGSKQNVRACDTECLFSPENVLGSFSAKIRVSYATRLISKRLFFDLDDIREIRNRFAHWATTAPNRLENVSFQTEAIRVRCDRLTCPEVYPWACWDELFERSPERPNQYAQLSSQADASGRFRPASKKPRTRFLGTCDALAKLFMHYVKRGLSDKPGFILDY